MKVAPATSGSRFNTAKERGEEAIIQPVSVCLARMAEYLLGKGAAHSTLNGRAIGESEEGIREVRGDPLDNHIPHVLVVLN